MNMRVKNATKTGGDQFSVRIIHSATSLKAYNATMTMIAKATVELATSS
jgi:hypothetical protein